VIAGARTSAAAATWAIVLSSPVTTRWSGRVPRSITAAGSRAGRPAAINRSQIPASWRTPM